MPSSSAMTASSPQPAQQRSKFSDWVGNEDEEFFFDNRPKAQRGGKKGKKKKIQNQGQREPQGEMDWDAIYDPARPTILPLYRGSTEQEDERRDWKEHLYRHAAKKKGGAAAKSKPRNSMFAPPGGLSFAPPSFNDDRPATSPMDVDDDNQYSRSASPEHGNNISSATPVTFTATSIPDDATGEDAYMRRMRLSGMAQPASTASPTPPAAPAARPSMTSSSPVPPRAAAVQQPADAAAKLAAAKAKIAAAKAAFDAKKASQGGNGQSPTPPIAAQSPHLPTPPPPSQPETHGSSISRAPVRYDLAEAQFDQVLDRQDQATPSQQQAQQPRSKMPGQANFGARMLAKQGWKAGEGLGARGEGITTALVAQQQKRKKRSSKDGGGWAHPPIGKIVGGKKRKIESTSDDDGAYGAISQVVKLIGMLDGLDVTYELEENNLQQEIGEGFERDYGSIERIFIWREQQGGKDEVFVKFTNQVSALKCVNGCDKMTFADNPVRAKFFDTEKFEGGEYV